MRTCSRFAAMFDCRILNSSLIIAKGEHSTFINQQSKFNKAMKKETWKTIINIIVTILTALGTAIGVASCK